jgi:hypothetical protein
MPRFLAERSFDRSSKRARRAVCDGASDAPDAFDVSRPVKVCRMRPQAKSFAFGFASLI